MSVINPAWLFAVACSSIGWWSRNRHSRAGWEISALSQASIVDRTVEWFGTVHNDRDSHRVERRIRFLALHVEHHRHSPSPMTLVSLLSGISAVSINSTCFRSLLPPEKCNEQSHKGSSMMSRSMEERKETVPRPNWRSTEHSRTGQCWMACRESACWNRAIPRPSPFHNDWWTRWSTAVEGSISGERSHSRFSRVENYSEDFSSDHRRCRSRPINTSHSWRFEKPKVHNCRCSPWETSLDHWSEQTSDREKSENYFRKRHRQSSPLISTGSIEWGHFQGRCRSFRRWNCQEILCKDQDTWVEETTAACWSRTDILASRIKDYSESVYRRRVRAVEATNETVCTRQELI